MGIHEKIDQKRCETTNACGKVPNLLILGWLDHEELIAAFNKERSPHQSTVTHVKLYRGMKVLEQMYRARIICAAYEYREGEG